MREASMSEDSEQSAHEDKAESFSLSGWWSVVDMCDWFPHAKKPKRCGRCCVSSITKEMNDLSEPLQDCCTVALHLKFKPHDVGS